MAHPMVEKVWTSAALTVARRWLLRGAVAVPDAAYELYRVTPATWRFTAQHYEPWMESFARLHAWMTCQFAALHVPAYKDFLGRNGWKFTWWDLGSYPPTTKDNYVKRYPEELRCWNGELELQGTVVDESSGSSGTPFNWVRGKDELEAIHRNVAGFTSLVYPRERLFVINAYSMGAWATGTNTGIAMARIAMVKNTGPDLPKIIDTIEHFGPDFNYIVTAYPPFLKDLRDELDTRDFDWRRHRLYGLVGGEAMTEALRDYLEERFVSVRSGYGASDLTIGLAGETDLTVWLRKRLLDDHDIRTAVLGPDEDRTPMIFQFNPLETFLEVNEDNELICTLNSTTVLSPKLRYNIGDEARIISFPELEGLLTADRRSWAQAQRAFASERIKLPLLLLFGRADSTISFMGANIYPQDVEYGLYEGNDQAHLLASFMLTIDETESLDPTPVVHLQLREGVELDDPTRLALATSCQQGVVSHLAEVSRDFAQSLEEDPDSGEIDVRVHDFMTGPFETGRSKIKNVYLRRSSPADASPRQA